MRTNGLPRVANPLLAIVGNPPCRSCAGRRAPRACVQACRRRRRRNADGQTRELGRQPRELDDQDLMRLWAARRRSGRCQLCGDPTDVTAGHDGRPIAICVRCSHQAGPMVGGAIDARDWLRLGWRAAPAAPQENPPRWVERALGEADDRIAEHVPARKQPGSLEELGCGRYGCVFPSVDPRWVFKITSDETEATFVAAALRIGIHPGLARFGGVYALRGQKHRGDRLFVLWREYAEAVGAFGLGSSRHQKIRDHDLPRSAVFRGEPVLHAAHDAAAEVWSACKRLTPEQDDEAVRLSRSISTKRKPKAGVARLAWSLARFRACAQELVSDELLAQVGLAMLFYADHGIVLGDVHGENLGLVERDGGKVWVVTDPGLALFLGTRWSDGVRIQGI